MRAAVGGALGGVESVDERIDVVAVNLACLPAERGELGAHIAGVAHIGGVAVDLQMVAVDDGHKVVQVLMGGPHGGLPNLALLALAVAEQAEHTLRLARQLQAGGHAGGDGQALAERTGGNLDARAQVAVGMALQARAQLAQRLELLAREIAGMRERCVQRGRRMALRQNEPVAVLPLRLLRIMIHHAAEIQRGEDVGARKRAAGMSASRLGDHAHDVDAHIACPLLKLGHCLSFRRFDAFTINRERGFPHPAIAIPWLPYRRRCAGKRTVLQAASCVRKHVKSYSCDTRHLW